MTWPLTLLYWILEYLRCILINQISESQFNLCLNTSEFGIFQYGFTPKLLLYLVKCF